MYISYARRECSGERGHTPLDQAHQQVNQFILPQIAVSPSLLWRLAFFDFVLCTIPLPNCLPSLPCLYSPSTDFQLCILKLEPADTVPLPQVLQAPLPRCNFISGYELPITSPATGSETVSRKCLMSLFSWGTLHLLRPFVPPSAVSIFSYKLKNLSHAGNAAWRTAGSGVGSGPG